MSSNFVLKNKAQIRKKLKPFQTGNGDVESFELLYGKLKQLSEVLKNKLDNLPEGVSVALLGRYKTDFDLYSDLFKKSNGHVVPI